MRALADAGLRLAVTSNSDGTVEDHLARHEWVQVGDGPGVPVEVVTDSGVVGVGKPDAAGVPGDHRRPRAAPPSASSTSATASSTTSPAPLAVGMQAVHMDPFGLCDGDHPHIRDLVEVLNI